MLARPDRRHVRPARTLLLLTLLAGCGGDTTEPKPTDSGVALVEITPVSVTLTVGDTATLIVAAYTASGAVVTDSPVSWVSSDTSVASVTAGGLVTGRGEGSVEITATIADKWGRASATVTPMPVAEVVIAAIPELTVRGTHQLSAILLGAAGDTLSGRSIAWESSDTTIAVVDAAGSIVTVGAGTATITARSGGTQASAPLTVNPRAFEIKGLYTQFERRGWPSGWYSGDVIKSFNEYDSVVGRTVAQEVAEQLDRIRELGVNTITFELRTADAEFDPNPPTAPECTVSPALGLLWPQPSESELSNLNDFLDLAQSKEVKVLLRLVNTRMDFREEAEVWVGSILRRVQDHPALSLVLFEGDERVIDGDGDGIADDCGGRSEPPLWMGPNGGVARYVEWAIGFAHSLGYPYRLLSAQASVGNYYMDNEGGAGPSAEGRHLWYTPRVMKMIFDRLNVPEAERTYALSFYQSRRCHFANGMACTEASHHEWADETLLKVFRTIGFRSPARVIAVEMGVTVPVESGWNSDSAIPSLVAILRSRGAEGGSFWRWTTFSDSEESDAAVEDAIKRRGTSYTYSAAKDALLRAYTDP